MAVEPAACLCRILASLPALLAPEGIQGPLTRFALFPTLLPVSPPAPGPPSGAGRTAHSSGISRRSSGRLGSPPGAWRSARKPGNRDRRLRGRLRGLGDRGIGVFTQGCEVHPMRGDASIGKPKTPPFPQDPSVTLPAGCPQAVQVSVNTDEIRRRRILQPAADPQAPSRAPRFRCGAQGPRRLGGACQERPTFASALASPRMARCREGASPPPKEAPCRRPLSAEGGVDDRFLENRGLICPDFAGLQCHCRSQKES